MFGRRSWTSLAAVTVLAVVAAACGNDTNSGSSTTQGTSPSSGATTTVAQKIPEPNPCVNDPGVTDSTIKIGAIIPTSGPSAQSFADILGGLKARIDRANQTGELGKRKIELDAKDDGGDVTRNTEAARQLVESDKVFAIVEASPVANGSAQYLNQQAIPVTGWHLGLKEWSIYNNMFTFRLPAAADPQHDYSTRNNDFLKKMGATKLAVVGGMNASSATYVIQVAKSVKQLGQIQVVKEITDVPTDQQDFTSIVQDIKDSGADGVLTGMDFLQNTALSDALTKAGVHLKVLAFPGGYDPRVLGLPGIEGATFGLEFFPFELHHAATEAFDKYAPKSLARGQVPFIGWLSGEITIQGIKDAGLNCPTRKAFINNLRLEHAYTGGDAFDPVDLQKGFGQQFQCVYYVIVKNKAFVPLFGGKQFCGKPLKLTG
jgi:branched-chain amino acid transport system substrate-binding protein